MIVAIVVGPALNLNLNLNFNERHFSMDMKLAVIGIPVSDVDAAKQFYTDQVGFELDHDVAPSPGMRVVQMTPPGSDCSVVIGEGMPLGDPGTVKGPQLVVGDLAALRQELVDRGVDVTEVQQLGPEGAPGSRFAFFDDPDGNGWSLQEMWIRRSATNAASESRNCAGVHQQACLA